MTKKLRSTYLEQTQLVCAKNLETLDQLLRIGGRLWLQRMTLCLSCANLSIASRSELTKGLPFLLTQRRVWKSFWQGIPHVLMYVHYIYIDIIICTVYICIYNITMCVYIPPYIYIHIYILYIYIYIYIHIYIHKHHESR